MTPTPPAIPGSVVTACVLWILFGVLSLLGGVLTLRAGVSAYFSLGVGLIFLISGIQVLMAKASGLIGTGVVCIVLASIQLLIGLGAGAGAREMGVASGGMIAIIAVATLVAAGLLMLSGILAIVGNAKYKLWVQWKRMPPPAARPF